MSENNGEFVHEDPTFQSVEDQEAQVETKRHTPLSSLKDALAAQVEKKPVTYKIPSREGFEMRFNTNLNQDLLEAWRKASTRRKKGRGGAEEEVDGLALATKILYGLNEALIYHGEDAMDDDDEVLNLRNKELGGLLNAESRSPLGVLRALYGYDGHILTTMQDLLVECGYDTEVDIDTDEEDPTKRS